MASDQMRFYPISSPQPSGKPWKPSRKQKNLGSSELFGAIGTLNSTLKTIAATTTEKIPE